MTKLTWCCIPTAVLLCAVLSQSSYATTPYVQVVSPQQGLRLGTVKISGINFGATPGSVSFNGVGATVQSWFTDFTGTTTVEATVSSGTPVGPGQVTVCVYGGTPCSTNTATFTVLFFFATFPQYWVDNTVCNPPGGTYDTTVTLGVTNNIGPNNFGGEGSGPYPLTPYGLDDAMYNWRDNADNAGGSAHFANKWWLIQLPIFSLTSVNTSSGGNTVYNGTITGGGSTNAFVGAQFEVDGFSNPVNDGTFTVVSVTGSTITLNNPNGVAQTQSASMRAVISGSSFDSNDALISLPAKVNGSSEPSDCLVIDSTTPLTAYNIAGAVHSGTFVAGERVQQNTSGATGTLENTSSLGSFTTMELGPLNGYPSQTDNYEWVGQTSGAVFLPTTTPNPQMACGHGLPGFGGTRNPGCSSPSDKNSMWKVQLDYPLSLPGKVGINGGTNPCISPPSPCTSPDPSFCPSGGCWVNHVVLRDVEVTVEPGASPSAAGTNAPKLIYFQHNPLGTTPCVSCQAVDTVGIERAYVHGNDPGDSTQPAAATITQISGSGTDATYTANNNFFPGEKINIARLTHTAFNCTSCTVASPTSTTFEVANSTTLSAVSDSGVAADTSEDGAGTCTSWGIGLPYGIATNVDVTSGGVVTLDLTTYPKPNYFGDSMYVGETVTINGIQYVISAFNAAMNPPQFTVSPYSSGTQTNVPFSATNATGNITSFLSQYAPGCGDDITDGIGFSADKSWLEASYVEKVHWWQSESHAISFGFDNGPEKIVNNWAEGGANTLFSGGGPVDQDGGPGSNNEIRRNYLGRDLNYRQLSATAGNSPSPPWGCGPVDGTPSHNTCPFSWAIKNSLELKIGSYNLIAGNIVENSWSDGQTGWAFLVNIRTCSGGAICGIFDAPPPTSDGLPRTYTNNIRFESNWIRNAPQISFSNRSGSPGNGGGVSLPIQNMDYVNNLFTNIADTNQFGSPGHEWQWSLGQDTYPCIMSYTGTSNPYTVTANCVPYQADISSNIQSIVRTGCPTSCVTTLTATVRIDPILCQSSAATCISSGQDFNIAITPTTNWPTTGTFAMFCVTSPNCGNWSTDGTGATSFTYTDGGTVNSTLCSTKASCAAVLTSATGCPGGTPSGACLASLGFKMTDMSVGDYVYAYDSCVGSGCSGGGDHTCTANGYAVGLPLQPGLPGYGTTSDPTQTITGTSPTGLTIVYQVSTQPSASSANCIISNGPSFPKSVTLQNNAFLSPNIWQIQGTAQQWLPVSNYMYNNVFADNDSGHTSDVYCSGAGGTEGTNAFTCWDQGSFQFYQNVLVGRSSTNWSVVNCPGGSCSNAFPMETVGPVGGSNGGVNCPNSTADANCMGYSGFMNGLSATIIYPTGACTYDGSNPFNCPLMTLPWDNNFTYSNVSYVGSSSYSTQGVNTTQLDTTMTQTEYVCPAGPVTICGSSTGPYPD